MRRPRRSLRALVPLGAALASTTAGSTGCDCDLDCSAPAVEIHVAPDVAAVEVCDGAGTCTFQRFDGDDTLVTSRAFTVLPTPWNGPLRLRTTDADGTTLAERVVLPQFDERGECECTGNARIHVRPEEIGP